MYKTQKNKLIYSVLMLVCIAAFWLFDNFYTPATYSQQTENGPKTSIARNLMPSSTTGEIVEHSHYTLSYNEPYEQAEWVAYILKKEHLTHDDRKRPYFIEDPKVRTKSADWRNYKGSGYDRGHLCPAGDRRFTKQAYDETFYTSNISPQDRDFNAGIWNELEKQVRMWAKQYGEVFVVTAGVLEKGLEEIGEEDVDVPKFYYKIIARGNGDDQKVIAFLMEGKQSTKSLKQFSVPVDKIEIRTGIDFFEKLSKKQQNQLESTVDTGDWNFKF